MNQSKTSYHFKITTSDEVMEVFGTIMSHTSDGVVLDLWCPEEPCFTQRAEVSSQDIQQAIEVLIQEKIKSFYSKGKFTIRCLSY